MTKAPEMVKMGILHKKSDIWSLGICALELAEGSNPYEELPGFAAFGALLRDPPPRLKDPSKWSSEFCDFISVVLEKDHSVRPDGDALLNHAFFKEVSDSVFAESIREILECLDEHARRQLKAPVGDQFLSLLENDLENEHKELEESSDLKTRGFKAPLISEYRANGRERNPCCCEIS